MSSWKKVFEKVFILFIIVAVFIGFREEILTNKAAGKAFGELLGTLPYFKKIADLVVKFMKFSYEVPDLSEHHFMREALKLVVMAWLQPVVVGFATRLFLPMPSGPTGRGNLQARRSYIAAAEDYMNSPEYRFKSFLIKLLCIVPTALLSGWLLGKLQDFLIDYFGKIGGNIIIVLVFVLLAVLSLNHLVNPGRGRSGWSMGHAAIWRGFDLLSGILNVLATETLLAVIYVGVLDNSWETIGIGIFSLIITLVLLDGAFQEIRRAIV